MNEIWRNKYVRVLSTVLVLQAVLFYSASHGDSRPLRQPLKLFPQTVPGWQMISQGIVEKEAMDVLKADDVLDAFYSRTPVPDPTQLTREEAQAMIMNSEELFIAFFSTQQQGQSPHSPKNCLPAAGWQPSETGEVSVPIPGLANPITINKYIVSKGERESLVLYWYQSHGRVVAGEFAAKYYLVVDSMRYHRSDSALVRVVVPVIHDDVTSAMNAGTRFVQAVFPVVLNYLPR